MHLTRNKAQQSVVARIMRERKMHQKSFSRKKYKTWKAAEAEARKWVDQKEKELPPSQQNSRGRMTKSNKSGVVGVCRVTKRVKQGNNVWEYPQWNAKWPGCEASGGIRWTINDEISDEDAFTLAVISLQMESVDRKKIMTRFRRIRGRKSHNEILAMKKI